MEITQVRPADPDDVRRLVALTNAVRRADAPWLNPVTEHEWAGELHHGWDGDPGLAFIAAHDGVDVAIGRYEVSSYDNEHLAWIGVQVDPAARRRGHGSALLARLLERAVDEGRTSVGAGAWDAPGPRSFALRHGFEQRSAEVLRRQVLAEVDRAAVERLRAESAAAAADYDLVRWPARTPPEDLDALAVLTGAINDAPTDELDVEDEVYTPDRIVAYERAWAERGHRLYRLVARHRGTGELAGHTVVAVDGERPELGDQHDTTVIAAHRGHRLGVALKVEMLRWLAEAEPQLRQIDTWNAESNAPMIGVNELLGYRVLGKTLDFQRSLTG